MSVVSPNVSSAPTHFCLRTRVYYEDTDAGAIVYHATYLRWMERARTEWLRTLGCTKPALAQRGALQWVVAALNIDYRSPARLDDWVRIDVALHTLRRASLTLTQTCWWEPDGAQAGTARLLTHAQVRLALIHAHSGHPQPLPLELTQGLHKA